MKVSRDESLLKLRSGSFCKLKWKIKNCSCFTKIESMRGIVRAVVVAQLVERLLRTPEIHSLNLDIGENFNGVILSTNFTIEKTKIKKKRLEMAHR